jgi:polysaccharide deacetylase family protein (PEP-CTERM system associated)
MKHALTVDLEEFFQVHALSDVVAVDAWDTFAPAADVNTKRILDLLDESSVKATFFCLGWIAERNPDLIRAVHARGHEIACHGHLHQIITGQTKQAFREDVTKAKAVLEDCTGAAVAGYRAPTYSITTRTLWALDILEELGFRYDSSIFPIYHDNYGIPDAPRHPHKLPGRNLVEFPISTLQIGSVNLPISGGGYFRLLPYPVTRAALRHLEKNGEPFIFYIHPWEINRDTPRLEGMKPLSRFRTYVGIGRTFDRLRALVSDFSFTTVLDVLHAQGLLDIPDQGHPAPASDAPCSSSCA